MSHPQEFHAKRLLSEIDDKSDENTDVLPKSKNKKFLRVRVVDDKETKVNINIPIALAEVGIRMIPKDKLNIKGNKINLDEILTQIQQGAEGELVDIDVNENGKNTKIKIYID